MAFRKAHRKKLCFKDCCSCVLRQHDEDDRVHDGKNKKNSHSCGGWDPEIKGLGRLVPPEGYGETLGLSA